MRSAKWLGALPVLVLLAAAVQGRGEDDGGAWPAPVSGFKPVEAGEHPRLFFRKSDLPAIRKRAETPEGKAIIARLRKLLNGTDGESMPPGFSASTKAYDNKGVKGAETGAPGAYSISHVAGYGFLYQLTGDKKYAELGKQCFEKAFEGVRNFDDRYAWKAPGGALRAGPSLGWYAVGYDLCYDGWDEEYRKKIAQAIQDYNQGPNMRLADLVVGARHNPRSNHWGMQVGGGALAVLSIMNDPGVDMGKIGPLLETSKKSMIRNMTEGFGDGGYFAEGDGTGSMASHITFLPALQAWKTAGGQEFISPRPNARWLALKWIFLTIPKGGNMSDLRSCFPERGGYPHNIWARAGGISGAGYFASGYEAVTPQERAGMWWYYQKHFKEFDDKNGTPCDTISVYPHHSILALVNTPFDVTPVNPAEVMPRQMRDTHWGFFAFRNRWQDENDIVISQLTQKTQAYAPHGPDKQMTVWHHGKRENWGCLPGKPSHWQPAADGSAIVGAGDTWVAIDFSGASGADGMLVQVGGGASGKSVSAGGKTFCFKFLTSGTEPEPKVEGDKVVIGGQTVSFEGGKLVLGKMAGPWIAGKVTASAVAPPVPSAATAKRGSRKD